MVKRFTEDEPFEKYTKQEFDIAFKKRHDDVATDHFGSSSNDDNLEPETGIAIAAVSDEENRLDLSPTDPYQ